MQEGGTDDDISRELSCFTKPFQHYQLLEKLTRKNQLFLRRNLSYQAPLVSASYENTRSTHLIGVQLEAAHLLPAFNHGLVVYVAACHTLTLDGVKVLIPVSARAALLRPGQGGAAAVQLPVIQPKGVGPSLQGLTLLFLHAPRIPAGMAGTAGSPLLAPGMAAERRWLGLWEGGGAWGKRISCNLFASSGMFGWPRGGSPVLQATVPLGAQEQGECCVQLLHSCLEVHHLRSGDGLSFTRQRFVEGVRLRYTLDVLHRPQKGPAADAGAVLGRSGGRIPWWLDRPEEDTCEGEGRGQRHQDQQANGREGSVGGGRWQQQPRQLTGAASAPAQSQQGQHGAGRHQQGAGAGGVRWQGGRPAPCVAWHNAGVSSRLAALSRQPPPPDVAEAHHPMWVALYAMDGTFLQEQQVRGPLCPICSLRCLSFVALHQHLLASHEYFEFAGLAPAAEGEDQELAFRCRRDLYDSSGEFLPALELLNRKQSRESVKPWQVDLFEWWVPAHKRSARWEPGFAARLLAPPKEQQVERSLQAGSRMGEPQEAHSVSAAARAASEQAQHSHASISCTQTASHGSNIRGGGEGGGHKAGQRAYRGAAVERQPQGRQVKKRRVGSAPLAAATASQGLPRLTPGGRLKFYHSRTCVAMTQEELFAEADSDDESEESEWKRGCWERLYEAAGQRQTSQHGFMYSWNLFLRRNPLHSDADIPRWLKLFKRQEGGERANFHRHFAALVTNFWRFRLLTPDQVQDILCS